MKQKINKIMDEIELITPILWYIIILFLVVAYTIIENYEIYKLLTNSEDSIFIINRLNTMVIIFIVLTIIRLGIYIRYVWNHDDKI